MVEFDFHALLSADLETVLGDRSYRWFHTRLIGLLSRPDSLLAQHFAPEPEAPNG